MKVNQMDRQIEELLTSVNDLHEVMETKGINSRRVRTLRTPAASPRVSLYLAPAAPAS